MVPRPLTRMLFRDLWARRAALLALVLIAALGTASLCSLLAVYLDLDGARARFYSECRLGDLQLSLKRAPATALQGLADVPNLVEVEGRVAARAELAGVAEPLQVTAVSVPEEGQSRLNQVQLVRGRWFDDPDGRQVLLSDAFARAHELYPGAHLTALLEGEQRELLVVGTVQSPEFVYALPPGGGLVPDPERTGVLFLPERTLQQWARLDGACNELTATVSDDSPAALAATLQDLEERLEPYGVLASQPISELSSVRFLANELRELETSALIMPSVCLGVVGLVLNLVMGRMVAAQRPVVGTLRALGYSRKTILGYYLAYGASVGVLGGLLGMVLGGWMQAGMLGLYRQYYELPGITPGSHPALALAGLGASWLAASLGSLGAALAGARLRPASAMRPPGPEQGGAVWLERWQFGWSRLPFSFRFSLRAILRNPLRSLVAVATVAIATALLVEGLSMLSAVDFMLAHEFEKTSRQDLTLNLREPVGRPVVEEVAALPEVVRVEPQLNVPCVLARGSLSRRVAVTGLVDGRSLYTPLDRFGHPVAVPARGLVLSRKLAELLRVSPGDTVRLRPLLGTRESAEARVSALADTYVGLAAYARLEYLSRLLGEEWAANTMMIAVRGHRPGAALLSELHRRPQVLGLETRARALARLRETLGRNLGVFLGFILGFYGSLAFGAILNTALVSLGEREREVATLRVLGYTNPEIMRLLSGEGALLGGLGILLGLPGGILLLHGVVSLYSTELFRLPAVVDGRALALAALAIAACLAAAQAVVYSILRRLPWLDVFKVRE